MENGTIRTNIHKNSSFRPFSFLACPARQFLRTRPPASGRNKPGRETCHKSLLFPVLYRSTPPLAMADTMGITPLCDLCVQLYSRDSPTSDVRDLLTPQAGPGRTRRRHVVAGRSLRWPAPGRAHGGEGRRHGRGFRLHFLKVPHTIPAYVPSRCRCCGY